jgi:hypothetical protein
MIRRRSAIEPTIGHMKSDGKLGRNWLKGALGDAINAVLCGAGHNLCLILDKLKGAGQLHPILLNFKILQSGLTIAAWNANNVPLSRKRY